jgi:hypothetical protein
MQRSQRLTFLAVGLAIAAIAVVIILITGGGNDSGGATSAGTVPLLTQGKTQKLTYDQGDRVTFKVRANDDDEVHVHGYNIERELQAGKTATISFPAKINGVFEIELHHADVQLATLTVRPK